MRIHPQKHPSGIALIIVLVVIVALGILAGGFAYTMKVETKLARNASFDVELEWGARSGIELAKLVLGQSMTGPQGQVDSLNQKWAGGIGSTNDPLGDLPMTGHKLGNITMGVTKIEDADRKFNINVADEIILRQALTLIGADASESSIIIDSILDWRDPDDDPHSSGTETDTYETFIPPYFAKNGPIDDLTELLLVRGVTPALYWGPSAAGRTAVLNRPLAQSNFEEPVYVLGLKDLFTPVSSKAVNINTTSATVLQIFPEIDETIAHAILSTRAGPDGTDGTDDDMPFRSPQDIARVGGLPPQILQAISRYFTVRSLVFNVTIEVEAPSVKRTYTALLRRNSPRDIQVLNMNWQ